MNQSFGWRRTAKGLEIDDLTARETEIAALALYNVLLDLGILDSHAKSYDPLTVNEEERIAYSYVFDMEDGGRNHAYQDFDHLLSMMIKETVEKIRKEKRVEILRSSV